MAFTGRHLILSKLIVKPGIVPLSNEVLTWQSRVSSSGGTLTPNSLTVATNISDQLALKSYSSKVVYLLPFLGSNIAAALVPIRDTLGRGPSTNSGFLESNFSENLGFTANGSAKYLIAPLKVSDLGTNGCGGIGYWELAMPGSPGPGVEPIGVYDTAGSHRYVLDIRSTFAAVRWGTAGGSVASWSTTPGNGHYYGQEPNNSSRTIYYNGVAQASSSQTETPVGTADRNISIFGHADNTNSTWTGRGGLAYMTDGTMTNAEVTDFHTMISSSLLNATRVGLHNLSVNGGQPSGTSTFGSGNYAPGTIVPVSASYAVNTSLLFQQWSDDISYLQSGSGSNPNTIVMPASDIVVTAIYNSPTAPIVATGSATFVDTSFGGTCISFGYIQRQTFFPAEGAAGRWSFTLTLVSNNTSGDYSFAYLTPQSGNGTPMSINGTTYTSGTYMVTGSGNPSYHYDVGATVVLRVGVIQGFTVVSEYSIGYTV